ncbi:GntR family transcriptional regulator (plasmid) [Sinorhizobium meliloti]|nr:GntR family transcriptional regulator [Sinorhizobium meliloti]
MSIVWCPPDTRLYPTEICGVLNTSLTPVREAFIQLEIEEYIASSPGSGYYTKKLETKRLSDEYGVTRTILQDVFRGKLDELHRGAAGASNDSQLGRLSLG